LVRQALGPLTLQARRGGVVLRDLLCEAGADAAVVEVDQRRIAQAVRTVLAGAIGAAPKGSEVTATLRLTSSAAASEALAAATSSSKSSTKSRPQAAAAATTAAATPPVAVRSGNRRASLAAAGNNQNPMFAPAGTVPAPTKLSCFRRARVFIGLPDTEPVASASGGGGGIAGMVLLEVAHEGPGFEPRDAKAATQHAFAFNPNMLHGGGGTGGGTGSGLGMAIAKTIVEAQGGCMWVQSDGVGKGASFVMALPLSAATAPAPVDPPPCHPGTHAASTPAHDTHHHHHRNSSSTSLSSTATVPQWPLAKSVGSPDKPTPGVPADMSAGEASLGEAEAEDVKASSRVPFAPPLSPTPDAAAPVIAGNHVLVVEDSPVARTMLVRLLKSLGYTTSEAEDGQVGNRCVGRPKAPRTHLSCRGCAVGGSGGRWRCAW
jgi:CheY-like chemotaxis protein